MFVGLHSLKKNGKESSFVNWLSNLAEVAGNTRQYPSTIGAIPVALSRYQWTDHEVEKKAPPNDTAGHDEKMKDEEDRTKLVLATTPRQ